MASNIFSALDKAFTQPQAGDEFSPEIRQLGEAIRTVESGGNPNAVSVQGARGSMQIMPDTFRQYAREGESYDVEADRERAAFRKIADDFKYYGGDASKVAAAYIGGRGAVLPDGTIRGDVKDKLGTTPVAYAQRVMDNLARRGFSQEYINRAGNAVLGAAERGVGFESGRGEPSPEIYPEQEVYAGAQQPRERSNAYYAFQEGIKNYLSGLSAIPAAVTGDTSTMERLQREAGEYRSLSTAPQRFDDVSSLGDLGSYIGTNAVKMIPYIAEAVVTGIGGGKLLRSGATEVAEAAIGNAVKEAAKTGQQLTVKELADIGASAVSRSVDTSRKLGIGLGTYPSAVGDVLSNQYEESGKFDLATATALGVPYSALNAFAGIESAAGRGTLRGLVPGGETRLGRSVGGFFKGGASEALGNEVPQEVLNQLGRMAVNPEATLTDPDALARYKEAAILSTFLGGAPGALGGALTTPQARVNPNSTAPQNLLGTANPNTEAGTGFMEDRTIPAYMRRGPTVDGQTSFPFRDQGGAPSVNAESLNVGPFPADRPGVGQPTQQMSLFGNQVETDPAKMPRVVAPGILYNPVNQTYERIDPAIPVGRTITRSNENTSGPLEMVGAGAPNVNVNQGELFGMELNQQNQQTNQTPVINETGIGQTEMFNPNNTPTYNAAAPSIAELATAQLREAGVTPTEKRVAVLTEALEANLPEADIDAILTALAESKLGVARNIIGRGKQAAPAVVPTVDQPQAPAPAPVAKPKVSKKKVSDLAANTDESPSDVKTRKAQIKKLIDIVENTKDEKEYNDSLYELWKRWADGDEQAEKYFEENPLRQQERAAFIVREREERKAEPEGKVFKATEAVKNAANPDREIFEKYPLPENLITEGTTAKDMLDWLVKNARDKDHRDIAKKILARVDLSNIPILLVQVGDILPAQVANSFNRQSALGVTYFTKQDGNIEGKVYLNSYKGMDQVTLLHELIHAATMLKLQDPKARAELEKLMALSARSLRADVSAKPAVQFLKEVQAFNDVDEFIAYYFSSPSFRAMMETYAADGKPINTLRKRDEEARVYKTKEQEVPETPVYTLGQRIKDFFAKLFGFTKKYEKAYLDAVKQRQLILEGNANREMIMFRDLMDEAFDRLLKAKDATSFSETARGAEETTKNAVGVAATANTVKDVAVDKGKEVAVNTVGRIRRAAKNLMMLNMLEEEYGDRLPAIKSYRDSSKKQGATQRQWLEKAGEVENMRRKLEKEDDKLLSSVQMQATMSEIHPDVPFDDKKNEHLADVEGARLAHARLQAMWNRLSPEAKKVYKAELDYNTEARNEQEAFVNKLITEVYNKQIDEAKAAGDDKLVFQLESQRKQVINERGEVLSRIRGPYFNLSRSGDFVVVGKSDKFLAAEEKVEQANKKVRELMKLEEPNQDELTAARKEAAAARNELNDLKSNEADYVVERHQSEYRAKQRQQELGKSMGKSYKLMSNEFQREASGISPATLSTVRDAVARNFDPKVSDQLSNLLERLMLENLPDASIKKRDMKRVGVAGAEEDMGLAFRRNAFRTAFSLARLKHASDVNTALTDLRDQAKQSANELDDEVYNTILNNHLAAMEYKETPLQNAAVAASYVYHLAWSPAFLLQNVLQNPLLTVPMLGAKFGMAKSMSTWAKTAGEVTKHMQSSIDAGVIHFRLDVDKLTKDAGERKMLDYLLERGLIDVTIDNEMDLTGNPVAQKARQFMRWAAYPASWMEVVNRSSAALAAYRLAREKGMKPEEATKYAEQVVNDTHIDYSPENAPYLMRAGAIPLGKLFFQFRKFQLGMLYQMVRNFKAAVKGDKEAAKVLLNTLVMQQVVAGAAGFPLAAPIGFVASLVAGAFEDEDKPIDPEVMWRNFLTDLLGEDLGRVFAKGVPTLAGLDISGNVGLGNTFSLFPFIKDKQSLRDQGSEYLWNFFGPAGGMVSDGLTGFDLIMEGKTQKGIEKMLPRTPRNILKGVRFAEEGVTTRAGNEVIPADDIGPLSLFAVGAGIPLAEVNDMYLGKRFVEEQKAARKDVRNRLIDDMVQAKKKGEDVADIQEKIDAFNERNPQDKITRSTIIKSERGRAAYQKELVGGVRVGKREQNLKPELRFQDGEE